ncbi:MAG TPA: MFS transporter, partial [Parafilimonas sp.]|nr:MFS transporter [Parafilimonas sp.]
SMFSITYFRNMLSATTSLYRNAFKGLSRNTWFLSLVMLVNRSGTMVIPFMTMYCTQKLHFTLPQAGTVMGLFGGGAIVGAYIGGKITDKAGFYTQQLASLLLGGIMFITVGFLESFVSLCIGTFILSVCNESFRPANAAAIAYYSAPENRTRSYSLNRLSINLGWAVGGGLGGLLASINYHLLFWVDGCTNIVAALLLLKLLPYGARKRNIGEEVIHRKKRAYSDAFYVAFVILAFLFASCFFQLFTIQPVFFKTEWHFNEAFIGLLMALNGIIIVVVEMIVVYSIERKKLNTFFIRSGYLVAALAFACLNILPPGWQTAVLSIVLITIGEMLSMPFMNSFWIERSSAHNRGEYAALYAMSWSVAQIVGPLSGSRIAAHAGFSTLWWTLSSVCVAAAIGILVLEQKLNSSKKQQLVSSA